MKKPLLAGLFILGLYGRTMASISSDVEKTTTDLRRAIFTTSTIQNTNIVSSLEKNVKNKIWLDVYHSGHKVEEYGNIGVDGLVIGGMVNDQKDSKIFWKFFMGYHTMGNVDKNLVVYLPGSGMENATLALSARYREDQAVSFGYSWMGVITETGSSVDMTLIRRFRGHSVWFEAIDPVIKKAREDKWTLVEVSTLLSAGVRHVHRLSNGFSLEPSVRVGILWFVSGYSGKTNYYSKGSSVSSNVLEEILASDKCAIAQLTPNLDVNFNPHDKVEVTLSIEYRKNLTNKNTAIYGSGNLELGANILAMNFLRAGIGLTIHDRKNMGFRITAGLKLY
ncbi:MAG: hypothetical protein LBI29_01600 [Rickettsiales bacterium]|jgi:hypothetical protein|nr:hypothetical protein [Rickettsiales bacterium]